MCIFVDEINYLMDMVVFISVLFLVALAIFLLKGEGNSYGKNIRENGKNNIGISDKNFFL